MSNETIETNSTLVPHAQEPKAKRKSGKKTKAAKKTQPAEKAPKAKADRANKKGNVIVLVNGLSVVNPNTSALSD